MLPAAPPAVFTAPAAAPAANGAVFATGFAPGAPPVTPAPAAAAPAAIGAVFAAPAVGTLSATLGSGHAAITYTLAAGVETAAIWHKIGDAYAALSVFVAAPRITVLGGKLRMVVSGATDARLNGVYDWTDNEGTPNWYRFNTDIGFFRIDPGWMLNADTSTAAFYSNEDVASPDLVQNWTPADGFSGSVTVTHQDPTANEVRAAIDAAGTPVSSILTHALAAGSDGSGEVALGPEVLLRRGPAAPGAIGVPAAAPGPPPAAFVAPTAAPCTPAVL